MSGEMIETKAVGQLTDDERARLGEIVEWYECPLCNGEAPNFDSGKFCIACTDRGKLLSPTANIIAGMLNVGWLPSTAADEITRLRAELSSLRGEADVIGRLVAVLHSIKNSRSLGDILVKVDAALASLPSAGSDDTQSSTKGAGCQA